MGAEPTDRTDALVGTTIDDRYRVGPVLARGGFATVFEGKHLWLDIPVAIKILRVDDSWSTDRRQEALSRFLAEAKTTAQLQHPAIVRVLDSGLLSRGELMGTPWMALEWCEGETLAVALRRRRGQGGRAPTACWPWLRPVVEAIAHGHDHGVVHRDIKPSNIMMISGAGDAPTPRVLDFGISKLVRQDDVEPSGNTATHDAINAFSLPYAAPEQVSGTRTGPWTDVHALGLLLTEVLTDEPPYPSEERDEIYRDVFSEQRPTPAAKDVDAGSWEPVLAKAVALKPGERHPNAAVLLAALDEHSSVTSADGETPASSSRRTPAWLPALAGILALSLGGVLIAQITEAPGKPSDETSDGSGPSPSDGAPTAPTPTVSITASPTNAASTGPVTSDDPAAVSSATATPEPVRPPRPWPRPAKPPAPKPTGRPRVDPLVDQK